ncbi:MAG: NAD(P)/FAD-dependent oxidoreductase [Acidobacteria bacterium]|nr:NAD(P)/FAD-dependent oxidoreductase [Acidobacteriota bacterium]
MSSDDPEVMAQDLPKRTHFDAVIAGAGVAGGSCALLLARQGLRVALFEREALPRDKVCGEFLAPEAVAQLRELQLEQPILNLGGLAVTRAALHSAGGYTLALDLAAFHPGTSYGLAFSRKRLDHLLFESAGNAGADCRDLTRIDSVEQDGPLQRLGATDLRSGNRYSLTCGFFVDAAGRRSRFAGHPNGRRAYFGYKTHWPEPAVPPGQVHLFFFDGGYGGALVVEENRTCISVMATPELFRSARGDFSHLPAATIFQNKSARLLLASLEPSIMRWICTGPLIFQLKDVAATPWIHLGDAAGMIDPLTGEGMSFAFRSAALLAREVTPRRNYAEVKARFHREVRRELETCYRNSARLGRIAERPWLVDRIFQWAPRSRWITEKLVALTRPDVEKAGEEGPNSERQ